MALNVSRGKRKVKLENEFALGHIDSCVYFSLWALQTAKEICKDYLDSLNLNLKLKDSSSNPEWHF